MQAIWWSVSSINVEESMMLLTLLVADTSLRRKVEHIFKLIQVNSSVPKRYILVLPMEMYGTEYKATI